MTWLEAIPPLVIITAAVGAIGSLQGVVHRYFHMGKDKRVQRDHFDYMMHKRDDAILASGETITPDAEPQQ